MKKSCSKLFSIVLALSILWPAANAFIKLIPIASKTDLRYNTRVFNVSHIFHNSSSTGNQSLEFQIEIKRQIKDARLRLVYHGITKNGTVSSVLLKRQVDLCAFLRNPKSDRLLKNIYDYIKERSILPTRCPFAPGKYYMCDLKIADAPIPAFLPESEFMLEIVYYSQVRAETLVEFQLRGRLVRYIQSKLF